MAEQAVNIGVLNASGQLQLEDGKTKGERMKAQVAYFRKMGLLKGKKDGDK